MLGKPQHPRCFRKVPLAIRYFSEKNAWSDGVTFHSFFYNIFLPFVRRFTSQKVALVMDNCGPHEVDLVDAHEQLTILTLSPSCKSMFQPMYMAFIAAVRIYYNSGLLQRVTELIPHRRELRTAV